MATAETTVTGRYLDLNGNAISSAPLTFRLLDIGVDDDVAPQEVFARNPRSVQTDSSGDFSVVLWNNGSSDVDSVYEVRFPDNRTKRFIIPVGSAGGTIDLATLLALHQTSGSSQQSVIQGNLDQFAADPQSNSYYSSTTWRSRLNVEDGATADQTAGEIKTLYESNSDTNAFTDADHSKLDGIESGATADQTAGEIKTLYESNSDTNVFTDDDQSKLDGIESSATADQTASEIKTAYESNADTNVFTDADHAKLDGISSGATGNQTASEIKTAYESNFDTNAFTDADHSKLDGVESSADVTDTTNVTAAGALMDSELTNEAAVKAIDQGLATTDDVEFNTLTIGQSANSLGYSIDLGTNTGFKGIGAGLQDFGYYVSNTSVWNAPAAGGMYITQPLTLNTDLAITEGGTGASTASAARTNLGFITDTATLDFPSISSNNNEELTMTVTGAAIGDIVMLGAPSAIESDLTWCGYVSAADTVTVRLHNSSGGSVDPASATWKATVIN
jgi:hypothetical protein